MSLEVQVYENRNGEIKSWICEHAAPQEADEEGQIIVCEECLDALDNGAAILEVLQ